MMRNALLPLLVAVQATNAYKIALVPKMTSAVGFYGLVEEGCQDSADQQENVTCFYNGTFDASVEGSLAILNDLIDDDTIDGISISVLDQDAYTPVINRGIALGKPIITFDSDAPESNRLAYIGTNNYAMGRELAKLLKQIKPDGGTYGIVSGFGHNLQERVQGVRDGLEDTPWFEVRDSPKNGLEDSAISLEKMWELVQENPAINAIVSVVGLPMFPENTTNWKNFVDSNRDVLTVIADALPVQLRLMQTSYVDALVGQLPYNMGFQSAKTLLKVLDEINQGTPLNESLPSDIIFGTHQLEVLRIPLKLPPLSFNFHYLGNVVVVGYVLCAIIILVSLGFVYWTAYFRKNQVVRAGQPIFLTMICAGTILMASAIIPLSIDDENSQTSADIACMCSPWLITIGFTVSFSALFSKTWRLNQIFLSKNSLRRITVTEKDVMLPCVVLLTMNVIALICWTAIAPLKYVRTLEDGTDPWNRPIGSYGQCKSTSGAAGNSIPYLVVIAVINITALLVANFQAYRARNIRTDFNESWYIALTNASMLQAIVVCLPIIFLTRENPQAYFIVLSVVLFIVSGAILVFIFVPKTLALKKRLKNQDSLKKTVKISGLRLSGVTELSESQRADIAQGGDDQVKALLQQYQLLPWEDKMAVKKKLAIISEAGSTVYSSESLKQVTFQVEDSIPSKGDAISDGVDSIPESSRSATETAPGTSSDGLSDVADDMEA